MNTTAFLRLEGVNLTNFVYDTADLSTIRGGGLLLMHVAQRILAEPWPELQGSESMKATTGASTLLLEAKLQNAAAAVTLRDRVADFLRRDPHLRHATFVVDVVMSGVTAQFAQDRQRLEALNRHRQMTSLVLAVPEEAESVDDGVCDQDRIRPAVGRIRTWGKTVRQSASVQNRRQYGLANKQGFYGNEVAYGMSMESAQKLREELIRCDFSHSFEEVAKGAPSGCQRLEGKMAVVYLDANGFGNLISKQAQRFDQHMTIEAEYAHRRREFLKNLLTRMNTAPERWINAAGGDEENGSRQSRYRLETLLWGGDETIWIAPAWEGWNLLADFYRLVPSAPLIETADAEPLTHAGGLVFCSHKAPIARLTVLAEKLAELAKGRMKREAQVAELAGDAGSARLARHQNLFAYEVLESFDHLGGQKLADYHQARRPSVPSGEFVLRGADMPRIGQLIMELKRAGFPKSRLHDLSRPSVSAPTRSQEDLRQRLDEQRPEFREPLRELESYVGTAAMWMHLDQLWDYVAPDSEPPTTSHSQPSSL